MGRNGGETMPNRFFGVMAGLLLVLATGCGSAKDPGPNPFFEEWKVRAESATAAVPGAKRQQVDLTRKTLDPASESTKKIGQEAARPLPTLPVTLRMNAVELPVLLRALARAAGQNIMINERVTGKVQINIENVPWDQAFRAVLRTHGLAYAWEGEILRIMTAQDQDEDLKREAQRRELELVKPMETRIVRVDYADPQDLKDNLQGFLARQKDDKSRGSIMVDKHSNALIIQAIPEDIDRIVPLIEALDQPTPQVLIEAHIVEANQDTARELGVEWGGLAGIYSGNQNYWLAPGVTQSGVLDNALRRELSQTRSGNDTATSTNNSQTTRNSATTVTGSDTAGSVTTNRSQATNRSGTVSDNNTSTRTTAFNNEVFGGQESNRTYPASGTVSSFPAAVFPGVLGSGGLALGLVAEQVGRTLISMQLNALEEEGKLNILSRPSITTLDNKTAIFESGREVPYQTVEDNDVNIQWKKASLILEVTPHVIDGKTLKMHIRTNKDEIDFSNAVNGNPAIITKRADTNVILRDGQTTVIGGLSKQTGFDSATGIPWLKDAPLLGNLFKTEGGTKSKEEILIFITPHILKAQEPGAAVWSPTSGPRESSSSDAAVP